MNAATSFGKRAGSLINDVRALGIHAPVRAGYELAKKTGAHRLVFKEITSRPSIDLQALTNRLPAPPASAQERAKANAVDGVISFGRKMPYFADVSPHALIDGPGEWPIRPWWEIDIRSGQRAGDVKWAWERGRFASQVMLARAGNDAALNDELDTWFGENPSETGVHWYSNLELSIRAWRLAEIVARAGSLNERSLSFTRAALTQTARHLLLDLPYTLSTMRNNHLLGDALGMLLLAEMDAGDPRILRPAARKLFGDQLLRHMLPDGSMIEDSVSYHRFVLEMFTGYLLLERDPIVEKACGNAAQYLARLGVFDGPIPQFGDWDEGRFLVGSNDPTDLAGSTAAALALAGGGATADQRERYDECAWYAHEGEPLRAERAETDGRHLGGGIARTVRGPFTTWLKADNVPWHNHADLTSVSIRTADGWLVGDPGTGTYNGAKEHRNHHRSSVAHNVLRLADEDQLVPHRVFRWAHQAGGRVGEPIEIPGGCVMWGMHNAYCRLDPNWYVVRAVLTCEAGVAVVDWAHQSTSGRPWALALPFGPDVEVAGDHTEIVSAAGKRFLLDLPSSARVSSRCRGEKDPYDGWWSDTYGQARAATRMELNGIVTGPVAWAVRVAGSEPMERDGETVHFGAVTLSVGFNSHGASVAVDYAGTVQRAAMEYNTCGERS